MDGISGSVTLDSEVEEVIWEVGKDKKNLLMNRVSSKEY